MSGLASLGVCLVLAGSPGVPAQFMPVTQFTLAWTHSIEKVRWEEDYRVVPAREPSGAPRLVAVAARIKGSAAGMEPPSDAVLRDGWYEYRPSERYPGVLRLTRSTFTPDFDWCVNGKCLPLSALMPSDGDITLLSACQGRYAGVSP